MFVFAGHNFAAGMSGGIAYVLNMAHTFSAKVNQQRSSSASSHTPYANMRITIGKP